MAIATLVGKDKARSDALKSIDALEAKLGSNIAAMIVEIDLHIKSLTPVNTGEAVRNYIWTRNVPNMIVYAAIDNGHPGPTNSMPLGSEPRRRPNEEAAALSLGALALGGNPFDTFYLSNNAPDIAGLELGILPGPPWRSRSPQGMFGITSALFNTLVAAKGII